MVFLVIWFTAETLSYLMRKAKTSTYQSQTRMYEATAYSLFPMTFGEGFYILLHKY